MEYLTHKAQVYHSLKLCLHHMLEIDSHHRPLHPHPASAPHSNKYYHLHNHHRTLGYIKNYTIQVHYMHTKLVHHLDLFHQHNMLLHHLRTVEQIPVLEKNKL